MSSPKIVFTFVSQALAEALQPHRSFISRSASFVQEVKNYFRWAQVGCLKCMSQFEFPGQALWVQPDV